MQYVSFRIQNFKGIKDTKVSLKSVAGASVFAFVGLNESGKTTVLQAIHSFAPDEATSELLGGGEGIGVPFDDRVPRHQYSIFTGHVKVTAVLRLDSNDKEKIAKEFKRDTNLVLDIKNIPELVSMVRYQSFEGGDFQETYFNLLDEYLVKTVRAKKWRKAKNDERVQLRDLFYKYAPRIAYFPTSVFEFPEKVFLTNRGSKVDKFYRRVFQDILDHDRQGQTIENDIIRRLHHESLAMPWADFIAAWAKQKDKEKIQQVMDRAGAAVTNLVFGRWNQIFREDTKQKEIIIAHEFIEGAVQDKSGNWSKTEKPDIWIKFQIKDGTRRYEVKDRSLGFRWFFSFMLFTQFRVARFDKSKKTLLFLFDEPASNLHAASQQKLVESFPEIAQHGNVLAYTTHSHHMIDPKWLEQTFIVTNRSDAPPNSTIDEISLDDESLDVSVATYRSFVNRCPTQTSYFQLVLDRLNVVPSKFDMNKDSILLEGKSDYYILSYISKMLETDDLPLLPAFGAGSFGALASLHIGWNLNFLFLLDSDKAGTTEKIRYQENYGIAKDNLFTLGDLVPELVQIEDLLDADAKKIIKKKLESDVDPNKKQISRFFQECLASDNVLKLGERFESKSKKLITEINSKMSTLKNK